jgi:hypothetical protein
MKDLFEDAVGVAPPSTVDVDRLIARRTRIQRWQRAGQVGLAVVAVGAIGAVTTLLPTVGDGRSAGTPGTSASPTKSEETDAAREARLATALRAIVAERLPGMTAGHLEFFPGWTAPYDRGTSASTPPQPLPDNHQSLPRMYNWVVTATGPTLTADVSVTVGSEVRGARPQAVEAHPRLRCPASPPAGVVSCETLTGPQGERIRRQVLGDDGKGRTNEIWVLRPDLTTVLILMSWNGSNDTSTPPADKPVLTMDELTAVATDPRLAWEL